MTDRLPSGSIKFPSHDWGALAENPTAEIGAIGEAWICAAREAWLRAGGDARVVRTRIPDLCGSTARAGSAALRSPHESSVM